VKSHLSIEVREQERTTVLALAGELDMASNPQLEEAIDGVVASDSQLVVLDLGDLRFMDVSSLRVLVASHQLAERSGKRLVLANIGEQTRRLMTLTRVIDVLTVIDEPDRLSGP
jgi:anti-sigma B factor antagonist